MEYLSKVDELEFNVFELDRLSGGQGLSIMTMHIFENHELLDKLNINASVMHLFIKRIQDGYGALYGSGDKFMI